MHLKRRIPAPGPTAGPASVSGGPSGPDSAGRRSMAAGPLRPLVTLLASLLALAAVPAPAQVRWGDADGTGDSPVPAAKGGFVVDLPRAAAATTATTASPAPEPAPSPSSLDTLHRINAARAAGATCGTQRYAPVPPLAWNAVLERTAALHSREMAGRNVLSHDGADGSSVGLRMQRQGYAWQAAGENIAAGQSSTPAAIEAWMKSPGHCSNIMGAGFTEVGVASAPASGRYGAYYTMVLGRRGGGMAGAALGANDVQERDPKAALAFINRLRAAGGACGTDRFPPARPLEWDSRLERVAAWAALESVGRAAADDPGRDLSSRTQRAGYFAGGASAMGGSGSAAPLMTVQGWLGSESQCRDLLGSSYSSMALAGAEDRRARAGAWWWSLVMAAPMYGDRVGPAGTVDRSRTDDAVAIEVVNAQRNKGATCKGETVPPSPPLKSDARLDAVMAAIAEDRPGARSNFGQLLSQAGIAWSGGTTLLSGFGAHGLVIAIEDWVTGTYCSELLSPRLTMLGARAVAASSGGKPNYWYLLLVHGR